MKKKTIVSFVLATIVLLGSFAAAAAQGNVTIRRVASVPATCDITGATSSPMLWKISGSNKGLYTCIGGIYVYQTNTFGSGLVAKTMLYADASPGIVSTAAPANGQLLCGDTGNVPALCTPLGTANEILATLGAHSLQFGLAAIVQHKAGASFLFTDETDTTKKFKFNGSSITAGQTRQIALPDADTVIPVFPVAVTVTGPSTARTWTTFDADFTLARRNDFNAHTAVAAPATPAAGVTNTWVDSTDKNFKAKDDAGVVTVTAKPLTAVDSLFVSGMSTAGVHTTGTVETLLSSTAAVNMNTGTATTLYTSPTGRSTIINKVIVSGCSTSITTASYSFGWTSAAFADVIANAPHTELTGATLYTSLPANAGATIGTTGGTFKVLMNTLQGGAATCKMDVFGYTF